MNQLLLSFFIILMGLNHAYSQKPLLLFTKTPELIKVFENKSELLKTPIWNKEKGGFLFEIANDGNALIEAKENVSFKISNQKSITKNIDLVKGSNISVYKCLNNEKYCCETLNEKQEFASKKIYAMSMMKRSAIQKRILNFKTEQTIFVLKNSNKISWFTDSLIERISISDINTMDVVWEQKNYLKNEIILDEIANDKIIEGHKYLLTVEVKNSNNSIKGIEEFNYEFEFNSFAFLTTEKYFPTQSSIEINWETKKKIESILLKNSKNTILWESTNYNPSRFTLTMTNNENINKNIIPNQEYQLQIIIENNETYTYPFSIILEEEESKAIETLIE